MKKVIVVIGFAMLLLTYVISLSLRDTTSVPSELEVRNHPGFYDYRGALNVQTNLSSGFLSPADVIRAAQEAKLEFITFNELNRFVPGETPDGWQRQLLVINGGKYSYLESRVLSFDVDRLKTIESLGQAQTVIADLLSRVGSESTDTRGEGRDLLSLGQVSRNGTEWSGAYPAGLSGLEVLNIRQHLGHVFNNARLSFFWSLIIYPFNPDLALIRLFADLDTSFETWDRLTSARKTFGYLGSDAGAPAQLAGLKIDLPDYDTLFRSFSNHVLLRSELTGDYVSDRKKVLSALHGGQSYFAIDAFGGTKGFAVWYEDAGGISQLGARVNIQDSSRLMVRLPRKPVVPFETAIVKDSASIMTSNSTETEFRIFQPGVYRVVVRLFVSPSLFDGGRWTPWIVTNPITVLSGEQRLPNPKAHHPPTHQRK